MEHIDDEFVREISLDVAWRGGTLELICKWLPNDFSCLIEYILSIYELEA